MEIVSFGLLCALAILLAYWGVIVLLHSLEVRSYVRRVAYATIGALLLAASLVDVVFAVRVLS